jgi:hypothetical protein
LNDLDSEKNNHEVKIKPLPKDKLKKLKKGLRLKKHGASTILEEEEENNSDPNDDFKRQIYTPAA